MQLQKKVFPWLMWLLPLTFFAFQFILRLFPALIKEELFEKFAIDATAFGTFAAMYYLGYAGMQIPIAMLLDKWGPRWVVGLSIVTCAFACWLLMTTSFWPLALLSRFLLGVGSVVGFLGASKVISQWFSSERYGRMVGLTFSFGLIGALYGGRPVSMMIDNMGWRSVLSLFIGLSLSLALLVFIFLKQPKNQTQSKEEKVSLKAFLKAFFSNKALLLVAFSNFLMVGSLEGFADVWGVPYLMQLYDISKVNAASITSMVFFGMLFGGPLLAYVAERFQAPMAVVMGAGFGMALIFATMLTMKALVPLPLLAGMMFVVGLLCCYQVIVFAIGSTLVPSHYMGLTVAALNCVNMLGGVFFHGSIGHLVDFFWQNELIEGVKFYSVQSYTQALWLIPLASFFGASLLAALLVQKRRHKSSERPVIETGL